MGQKGTDEGGATEEGRMKKEAEDTEGKLKEKNRHVCTNFERRRGRDRERVYERRIRIYAFNSR